LEDLTPPLPVEERRGCGFQKPADYYSAPPGQRGKGIPRGMQIGCGVAGLLFIGLMFLGATFLSAEGAGKFMGFLFGRLKSEISAMTAADVTAEQKQALDRELDVLIRKTESNDLNIVSLQPLLREMREAVVDNRLSPDEVTRLTRILRELNAPAARAPQAK
jgi:hypothetical protein